MKVKLTIKYDTRTSRWYGKDSNIMLCSDGIQDYLPKNRGSTIVITAQTTAPKGKGYHKATLRNRYGYWSIYIYNEDELHALLDRDDLRDLLDRLTSNGKNMDIWFKINNL